MELLRWCRLQWDRVLGGLSMTLGVVLLVIGWARISATEFVAVQTPIVVSAGLGGLAAIMIGGTLWLSADLRDQWRALDQIEDRLRADDELIDEHEERIAALERTLNGTRAGAENGARRERRTPVHDRPRGRE